MKKENLVAAVFAFILLTGGYFLYCRSLISTKAKYSYALGYQLAREMRPQGAPIDSTAFSLATQDSIDGKNSRMSEEEMTSALHQLADSRDTEKSKSGKSNLAKSNEFLTQNKAKDGVRTTTSGLQYQVLSEGKGRKPKSGDFVEIQYRSEFLDGKEFDSTYSRNASAKLPINGLIPAWAEALQMMPEGSKYKLFVPPDLAYGEHGTDVVPANTALVFEIELLKIMKK